MIRIAAKIARVGAQDGDSEATHYDTNGGETGLRFFVAEPMWIGFGNDWSFDAEDFDDELFDTPVIITIEPAPLLKEPS